MKTDRKFTEILRDLAENSSLHGIPKTVSSKQRPVQVLWCLLFLATFTVFGLQLYNLFIAYYSWPVQTAVSLKFSPLLYPAVTFCNMNPVKLSLINDHPELKEVINPKKKKEQQTGTRRKREAGIDPSSVQFTATPHLQTSYDNVMPSTAPIEATPAESLSAAASIMPSSAGSGSYMSSSVGYEGSGNPSDYYYDYWGSFWGTYDWYDYYYNTSGSGSYYGDYTDSYLGNYYSGYSENYNIEYGISGYMRDQLFSPKDQWDERISQFQAEFKNETTDSRHDMGHSVKDMVVSASFASSLQNVSKFEALTTTQYGNCYTMSSPKYIAMRSGPAHGLKLTLNLEMDEYIKNFASGYGIRMVFHEPGTFPLPADEGMTLSPGFETSIGLRMVKVTRLGPPHGHCSDGVEFYERYKVRYSVTVCMMFCRIMKTIEKCECIPSDSPDLNFTSNKVDICHSKKNRACQLAVDLSFDDGSAVEKCNCVSPCKEVVYTKTMSGRRWPNDDYLENVLMGDICSRNISSMTKACGEKANNTFDPNTYRYNFLRVLIYFEDLNYERIDQTPLYESVRFLSDIGGAMGLFLGASLLSFVEILQLVLEMVLYLFRSRHPTTNVEHISQKEKTLNSKRDSLYPVPEKIKTSFFGESIRKSNPDPHAVNS